MNKRLIHRAMQKMVDQNPSRPLPVTTTILPGGPHTVSGPTTTMIGTSPEADEAMAARIRADIARAQLLREQREQQRQQSGQSWSSSHGQTAQSHGTAHEQATEVPVLTEYTTASPPPGGMAGSTGTRGGQGMAGGAGMAGGSGTPGSAQPRPSGSPMEALPLAPYRPGVGHHELTLDFDRLKEKGFLTPDDKTAKIHQEFRLVKRRLLDNAFGRLRPVVDNGRLIMVTSSLPGEGKTFSSINLAISIAIGGEHPVLLVDADIARPSVSNTLELDIPDEIGLADYLDDPSIPVTELLRPTSLPGLTLLPAGHLKHRPVDLLASGNMARLVEELRTLLPHHVIVFDSPPLLPVTETRSLSALVGQVMLVVAAGETPRTAVNESLLQLENCPAVGLLFNKAPVQPKAPAYYGY
ncbi:hypothetical protein EHV23_10885 [Lautropia dentalis]|jgi:hypothetical protein|uniref:Uncharacterized protein n=1 Tax=Lautropia dentalis TaxID=2490857 RepID=A0A3R8MS68_9BURK|nr:hypothetical protein [Lautropia dentalis]RRN43895.1 hypothetical protein EHV23_10885 [Lautropia dentalis]